MKDALILEQKIGPLKGPWGGIFKGEEIEKDPCGDGGCFVEVEDMLGTVTRTSGRILAT